VSTQSQALVTCQLDGTDLGTWRVTGDFEVSSDSTKRLQPGGGQKTYGARGKFGTLEVTRDYDVPEVDDFWAYVQGRVGVGKLTVNVSVLGDDFSTLPGRRRTYSGRLISAVTSGTDIEGTDVRTATITCDVESVA
jgi:hypothetical protein